MPTRCQAIRRGDCTGPARQDHRPARPGELSPPSPGRHHRPASRACRRGPPPRPGDHSAPEHGRRPSPRGSPPSRSRSEEHTSELQSRREIVCRLLLEKKKKKIIQHFLFKKKKKKKK